jgi:hypothetical protein
MFAWGVSCVVRAFEVTSTIRHYHVCGLPGQLPRFAASQLGIECHSSARVLLAQNSSPQRSLTVRLETTTGRCGKGDASEEGVNATLDPTTSRCQHTTPPSARAQFPKIAKSSNLSLYLATVILILELSTHVTKSSKVLRKRQRQQHRPCHILTDDRTQAQPTHRDTRNAGSLIVSGPTRTSETRNEQTAR